jgi:multidrug efflux system outer membrane protein
MKRLALCLPLGICLLAGCASMAPKYSQPAAPVAESWPGAPVDQTATTPPAEKPLAQVAWQEFFVDGQLRKLISLALENNRDLRVATLNIERSRALYQIRGADLWPKVDGSAGANWQRLPEDFSGTGQAKNVDQYTVGLGVSAYELDLFGRVRSLKEQALAQYLATEQAQRSVQISLVAQVAGGYLALASDRERLQLAQETLASQEASYRITKSRFEAGVANALTLSQAQTSVEAARVDIVRYTALVAQDENGLSLVVGSPVPAELLPPLLADTLTAIEEVTPGLPSEVLLKRPDIRQAENLLQGVNANIGAARAAFFPRITLVSSVGFGSSELSGLFSSGALAWSFAPRITLPIFDGGSTAANLKVAEVDRDIALAQYEKAIQIAFREVADGLAQRSAITNQMTAQQALVAATSESLRLSQARFDQGVDSYLGVLDSQRSLYTAQQNLITYRLARLTNLVTLYKVLGGGSL